MFYLPNRLAAASFVLFSSSHIILYVMASHVSPRHRQQAPMVTGHSYAILPRATETFTAVSDCHQHEASVFCLHGTTELQVVVPTTTTAEIPPSYTGCHGHDDEYFCVAPDGSDVQVIGFNSGSSTGVDSEEGSTNNGSGGQNCHFHAGVEHCTDTENEQSQSIEEKCSRRDREYNVPLRIGLLFVILVTSFIGVAGPIFLKPVLPRKFQTVFIVLKQFGTGVVIATAFVHLLTHAQLMFSNECIGELQYEGTTAAIVMAGLFLAFTVETISHRLARKFWTRSRYNDEVVGVAVLEAGIIFHSLLIGVTLVVSGDSFFITLFVVILFHQMFEGIALGTRIASVGHHIRDETRNADHTPPVITEFLSDRGPKPTSTPDSVEENKNWKSLSMPKKLLMAVPFALITPIGMAIGIGVLRQFNGNDPSTLIALGTLDALSAGILIWVGVVEMWAGDWMFGELANASFAETSLAGFGLIGGLVLMCLLGKWA
ncbi:Zip-domain-containing protein [Annulohypoxylon truncatum]|uniref:Zip-domain-containing protein n=1 Tax=Annulohypoxylon truncatum TaxID=327061 RepID=UPI0020079FDA|nr:Zip-domain-containing protein [Annulohypoxylon truncatum]KAI1206121.1 Zip-domain-containing protein [Annulohypoxylon truncatum]